jgi:hypothetical protein
VQNLSKAEGKLVAVSTGKLRERPDQSPMANGPKRSNATVRFHLDTSDSTDIEKSENMANAEGSYLHVFEITTTFSGRRRRRPIVT